MSNKFYKPKNELGQLLISEVKTAELISDTKDEINSTISDAVKDLNEVDKTLTTGLENLVTSLENAKSELKATIDTEIEKIETTFAEKHSLVVRRFSVPSGVSSYDELDNVITPEWEAVANDEAARKIFAKQLAETIFIAKSIPAVHDCGASCECEDAYEEFYCINAASITEGERPKFTRFGAVDSILASDKLPGSVVLRGTGIYDTEDWSIYENKTEFQDEYHPVTGYAVAPIALREFKNKDKELSDKIDEVKSDLIEEDSKIVARIEDLDDVVAAIRGELEGTIEGEEISGSRIDRIEDLIGLKGCSRCGHDKCAVNPEEDGSILCRLTDLKDDSQIHWEQISAMDTALGIQGKADEEDEVTVWGSILKHSKDIATHTGNISGINEHLANHNKKIAAAEANIATNVEAIATNAENIATNTEDIATNAKNIAANATAITAIETSLGHNNDENDSTPAWHYIKTNNDKLKDVETFIGYFGRYPEGFENYNITGWAAIDESKKGVERHERLIAANTASINSVKDELSQDIADINTAITGENGINNKINANAGSITALQTSVEGLTKNITNIGEAVTKIDTTIGSRDESKYPHAVWNYIVATDELAKSNKDAIEKDGGIKERLSTVETSINDENNGIKSRLNITEKNIDEIKGDINDINETTIPEINKAITKTLIDANKYTDDKISEANKYTNDKFGEANGYTNGEIIKANSYADTVGATTLTDAKDYTNVSLNSIPKVAVINCGLKEGEVIENDEAVWSNSTIIFASDFVARLPHVNNPKNVNFAVTSVRYTSDEVNIAGEQITPEILYYGDATNDATNGRSARITFNDFKRKPQTLLVTITYWEDDMVLHV